MNILFSKKNLVFLLVFAPTLFGATATTSGLITNSSAASTSANTAQSSLIVAGSSLSPVIMPSVSTAPNSTTSTVATIPVAASTSASTPITTPLASVNSATPSSVTQSAVPALTPISAGSTSSNNVQALKPENNQLNSSLSSGPITENVLPKSPFTPDLSSSTVQINKNAPVITIKVGDSFIINGPKGSKIHPTTDDLNKKIKTDKEAHSKNQKVYFNPVTAINSVVSNNDETLTVTGVRACTQEESPYPVIIQKDLKYTTVARIRVIE